MLNTGLIFFDGFEVDRNATAYIRKSAWATGPSYARFGGSGLYLSGNAPYLRLEIGEYGYTNVMIVGIAIKTTTFADWIFRFLNDTGDQHCGIQTISQLKFAGYGPGEVHLGSSTEGLTADAWSYLEARVVIHPTAGEIRIKLNDRTILWLKNVNTQAGSDDRIHAIILGKTFVTTSSISATFDDFYVVDGTAGGASFLGDARVRQLVTTSDESVQFTPSTGGTNYNLVDEVPPDPADYVKTSNTAHRDLYGLADSPYQQFEYEVVGVKHIMQAHKTDGVTRKLRGVLVDGANEHLTDTRYLSQGDPSGLYQQVFDSRPVTGDRWSIPSLDTLKAGQETIP